MWFAACEIHALGEAISRARMREEVEQAAREDLRRLGRMPEAAGALAMLRTDLDRLVELPWADPEETPTGSGCDRPG